MPRLFSDSPPGGSDWLPDLRPGAIVECMVRPALGLLLLLLSSASPSAAVEYRLRVSNLFDTSFAHYLDGKIGRGEGELALDRLERSLDGGLVPKGALLYDRILRPMPAEWAQGFKAIPARGEVTAAENGRRWEEVVWDGKPGERSVWLIAPPQSRDQEVIHLALKGKGSLRYHIPYTVSFSPRPAAAVSYPLHFLRFYGEKGNLWERYLSRSTALLEGIAAVVGVNENPSFGDWVYIVVEHPPGPTTFKAVVGWDRRRSADRSNLEGPGERD